MDMALRFFALFVTAGQAIMYTPRTLFGAKNALNVSFSEDGDGACRVPSGRLLFLHIMKAGGTSVDAFLACHCVRVGCSVELSLGPLRELHGHTNCDPSVCTTHGDYRNRKELCGDDFENPDKIMTAFREPVSRVFSLYNYMIEQGHPLKSIAVTYDECDAEQVNEDKPFGWLCAAMTNHMVQKTFAEKDILYSSAWNTEVFNYAKKVVSNLDATFFMEDFDQFATGFGKANLVDNTYLDQSQSKCELGHSNPTDCPKCAKDPTAEEVELIKRHNEMDIALYNFAAKLPNRQGQ